MMENKCKRFLSLLLAFVMVLGMFPAGHAHVHAAEAGLTPVAPEAGKTYVICFKASNGDYYAMTSTFAAKNNHGTLLTEKVTGTYNEAIGWKLVAADDNGGYYLNAADDGYGLSLNGTISNDAFADANHPAEVMTLEVSGDGYVIKNPSGRYVNALGDITGANSWGACGNYTTGTTVYFFEIPEISINLTEGETYVVPGVVEALNVTDNEVIDVKSDFVQGTVKNHKLATTIEDGVYVIVNTRSNKWLLNTPVDGAKKLQNVAGEPNLGDNAYLWTVTAVEGEADTYYLGNNGKYLNLPGYEQAELVSDETATVKITASTLESNAWEIFDTNTYMNDLGNAVGSYAGNDEDPGSQWVFFKVSDVPACTYAGVEELPSDATITSGNEYLLVNIRNGNKTLLNKQNPGANACLYLNGTANAPSNNAVWTITEHEGSYYIQDQNGKYLTFSSSAATVTTDSTPVSIGWQGFGSLGEAWAITRPVNGRKEYMSNPGGGSTNSGGGWHEENDGGSRWKIYTTSTTPVGTYDVTVTGKGVGEATVVIGMAIYTFHVSANHVHNFVGNVTTPANCVDVGVKTFTCECGEGTYTEVIPVDSKNHKTTEIRPEVKPTLTKEGKTEEVYCTACNTSVSGGETIPQLTMKNAKVLSDNRIVALSGCEYLLTSTGENTWSLSHAGTYFVKPSANGNNAYPQSTAAFDQLTLTANGDAIWIGSALSGSAAGTGSIHVHNNSETPYWDRCSGGHGNQGNGTHDLYFFIANNDGTGAEIPGYTMVKKDALVSGNSYLIAFKNNNGTWYIMNPSDAANDHVALLVTDAVTHTHDYTVETVTKDPTCAETGLKDLKCSCGHFHAAEHKNVEIPATGEHTYTYDCDTNCKVCGQNTRPGATHVSDAEYDCVAGKCRYCETPMEAAASHTPAADDGDCTTAIACSVCGQEATAAKSHAWAEKGTYTEPTFEADGFTTYNCTNSGCTKTNVVTHEGTKKVAVAEANGVKYATLQEAVDSDNMVYLLADVELTERLDISGTVNLVLNSYTISGDVEGAYGMIYVKQNAMLTIEGAGSIIANKTHAIGNYGIVAVDGVEIVSNADDTYAGLYNFYYQADYYGYSMIFSGSVDSVFNCGNLNVYGGHVVYLDNSGKMYVGGGQIDKIYAQDGSDAPGLDGAGTITIADPANITVPEGFKLVKIGKDTYQVVAKTYVAEINGIEYETLAEALSDAQSGDIVKLLADSEFEGTVPVGATLDLNSHKLIFNGIENLMGAGRISINGGTIVVKQGEDEIEMFGPNALMVKTDDGVLLMIGDGITMIAGTFNFNWPIATMTVAGTAKLVVESSDTTYIYISLDSTTASIEGPEGMNVTTDVENHEVAYENGTYTLVEKAPVAANVAMIGERGYETLAAAIAAAQNGNTIEMLADVEVSEVILIDKSLTINGNGHKVTSSASRVIRITTSNVEVEMNNVNVVSTAVRVGTNDIRGIAVDAGLTNVKLTLNGCSVDFTDASACDWAYGVNIAGNGTDHILTINGGSYEGANVINVNGADNTIIVKDATLNCLYPNNDMYYGACIWVLQNQGSEVEATGNTFNGNNAVVFNVGTGTTVTESNNTDNTKYVVAKVGQTYYYTLAEAVANVQAGGTVKLLQDVEENISLGKSIALELMNSATNAGTFTLTGKAVVLTAPEGLNITTDVENHEVVYENGTYKLVEKKVAVAKIGEQGYETLAAAIAAAKAGDTITFVADITESVTINKSVTIDGADKTYTGTMTGNAGLTITIENVDFVNGGFSKTTKSTTGTYTIKNCTFDGQGTYTYPVCIKGANKLVVEDCVVSNYLYSFLYVNSGTNTVSVKNVTVENCSSYAVYFASGVNNATFENLTVKNSDNGFVINNTANRSFTIKDCKMENVGTAIAHSKGTKAITCTAQGNNDFGTAVLSEYAKVVLTADATLTAPGGLNVTTNAGDGYKVIYEEGVYKVVYAPAAMIGEQGYATLGEAFAAAQDGDTIVVMKDIDLAKETPVLLDGSYNTYFKVEGKNVTIDMSGMTISGAYTDSGKMLVGVFSTDNGGHLTVTGNGTVNLTATAKVYSLFANYEPGCSITIEDGAYTLDKAHDSLLYSGCNTAENEGITVNGGTFILGNVGTGTNGKPWIINCLGGNDNATVVNGGTFNSDISHQFWANEVSIPADLALKNNGDGTWTLVEAVACAEEKASSSGSTVRKVGYATLQEAIDAVANGKTVTLLKDIELGAADVKAIPGNLTAMINVAGKSLTLDMSGKTITAAYDASELLYTVIYVGDGASLTVKGDGKIDLITGDTKAGKYDCVAYMFLKSGSTGALNIENGTFTANKVEDSMVYTNSDKVVNIKGGNWTLDNVGTKTNGAPWIFNTKGQNERTILVSGGTYNYDVSNQHWIFETSIVDANGNLSYVVDNGDGTWTVTGQTAEVGIAKTVNGYIRLQGYATFKDAVASIAKGAAETTIVLQKDITVKGQFIGHSYAQKVVIDLNGYTMSSTDKTLTVYRAGTEVTVKNGTVYGNTTGGTIQTTYGGKLTLGENVTIKSGGSATALKVDANSTLIVDKDTTYVLGGKNDLVVANGAKVQISAGYFKKPVQQAWCAEGYVPTDKLENGYYSVMEDPANGMAAVINGTYYATLQEAIAAAATGDTITVLADIAVDTSAVVANSSGYAAIYNIAEKDIIIDLNGKKIEATVNAADLESYKSGILLGVFCVDNNGELTLTGNGTVTANAVDASLTSDDSHLYSLMVAYGAGSKLTVENGTFHANSVSSALVYSQYDEIVTINGGTYTLGNLGTDSNGSPWLFNAKGQNERNILVNGGTFSADIQHQYYPFEVQMPKELALSKGEDGMYTVVPAVAYVNEQEWSSAWYTNYVGYATVEEAMAASEGVKTVVSGKKTYTSEQENVYVLASELGDVVIPAEFTGSLVLDNCTVKSITNNSATAKIVVNGNVVVENDNGSAITGEIVNISGTGTLTAIANGEHAYGIGGDATKSITIENVRILDVKGGYVQPDFVYDTKYGKSEPEGGAAIGSGFDGAVITLTNVTIDNAQGGSKAAGIGARYHTGVVINITDCTIKNVEGGNASAGIGGSRVSSGRGESGTTINILNSTITAKGGQAGAGIGSGYDTHCQAGQPICTINIDGSTINAVGGKYAAGVGTGYHNAGLAGEIKNSTVNAASGEKFYKDTYTQAMDIGFGVVDPAREARENNSSITFNGEVIAIPAM